MTPEISVLITLYQEGDLLRETIDSVLDQTFKNFEIVLVDNNAFPETLSIATSYAERFPDRIRIVKESEQGICSARNTGIRESRGTYIALLDGDDVLKPGRLEKQIAVMKDRPGLSMVTCTHDRISHDSKILLQRDVCGPSDATWKRFEEEFAKLFRTRFGEDYLASFSFQPPSTYFFKKETAIKAGLFDLRLNPRWGEEVEFETRMFEHGPFYCIMESLVLYRTNSPEAKKFKDNQIPGQERFLQDHKFFTILWEHFAPLSNENIPVLKNIRALWLRDIGHRMLVYRQGKAIGKTLIKRSLKANPEDIETWKFYLKTFFPHSTYPKLFWFETFNEQPLEKFDRDFATKFLSWPPAFLEKKNP
ncbi:MAG: glycosyltransferase family 2 protein [Nitrospiraceae bacterium]|nr:glycosyltransferase family 2 protein [Nitrospiraceae bacterium]